MEKDLVEYIAKTLVDDPTGVVVNRIEGDAATILELKVAEADVLRESDGLELTPDPEQADVVLLNTCSVREKAQEKVFSQLGKLRLLKRRNPALVIGVGGCVASQEGEGILERAPFVAARFGGGIVKFPSAGIRRPGRTQRIEATSSYRPASTW